MKKLLPEKAYLKLYITALLLSMPSFLFSQENKKIELLNANSLEFDKSKSNAKRLIGDVGLKHDGMYMFCDSAYLYSEENKLEAYGNVRLKPDAGTNIYGDTLYYDGKTKYAKLRGVVKMIDKETQLTTKYLDYNQKTDLANYWGGGNIINTKENSTLTSTFGYYYPKSKEFFFKDKVILKHPDYLIHSDTLMHNTFTKTSYFYGPTTIRSDSSLIYCESGWYNSENKLASFSKNAFVENNKQKLKADSIYYDKGIGIARAYRNVAIIDTTQDMIVTGDYSIYYEKDSISIITGNALLTQYNEKDTLYLHGDTLYSAYDSTRKHRMLHAFHKVKFYKADMQGQCDSLVFSDADSTIKLFRAPIIWSNENQMTAKYIEIKNYNGKVHWMRFDENAFIISEVDTVKYNQIKGNNMFGYFNESKLYRIDVKQNGQTIYYAKEDNGDMIGVNRANCEDMAIYINDNKVKRIAFKTKTSATLYPLDEISADELLLKDFSWKGNIRPMKKEDVFVW